MQTDFSFNPISADDLLKMEIPKPPEIIKGLLPIGYSMIAAPPKQGKSFTCLNLAIAVSCGGRALGALPAVQGEVLYLALEDNYYRVQKRLRMLTDEKPKALKFALEIPKFPSGGLEELYNYIHKNQVLLTIIDTLGKVRDAASKSDIYQDDYKLGSAIQALALSANASVLVVHHTNKSTQQEGIGRVGGSTGVTAALDCALMFDRDVENKGKASIEVISRDIEPNTYELEWNRLSGGWVMSSQSAYTHWSDKDAP